MVSEVSVHHEWKSMAKQAVNSIAAHTEKKNACIIWISPFSLSIPCGVPSLCSDATTFSMGPHPLVILSGHAFTDSLRGMLY
jgi:hypothetical protein